MLGLVTNHQAGIANNGPGARFEFLESLPPEQRPTHFAYYPGWMGTHEFFGEVLHAHAAAPRHRAAPARRRRRHADHRGDVGSRRAPASGRSTITPAGRWSIASTSPTSRASARTTGAARMGRRHFGDPTARWSIVEREIGSHGLVIDGGRTIREGGETFTVARRSGEADARRDPHRRPDELWLARGDHEADRDRRCYSGKKKLGELTVAPPAGMFSELTFNIAAARAAGDGERRSASRRAACTACFTGSCCSPSNVTVSPGARWKNLIVVAVLR